VLQVAIGGWRTPTVGPSCVLWLLYGMLTVVCASGSLILCLAIKGLVCVGPSGVPQHVLNGMFLSLLNVWDWDLSLCLARGSCQGSEVGRWRGATNMGRVSLPYHLGQLVVGVCAPSLDGWLVKSALVVGCSLKASFETWKQAHNLESPT
jgi:hypothetical protein